MSEQSFAPGNKHFSDNKDEVDNKAENDGEIEVVGENEQLRDEATTRNINRDKSTPTTTNCNPNENRDSPVILKKCVNQKEKFIRSNHRTQYNLSWETLYDAQYKTCV